MDNIIKNAVGRYLASQPSTSSQQSNSSSHEDEKEKKTENRLSGLLTKIRSKSKGKQRVPSAKTRRVQVKWQRFDTDENCFDFVRVNNGGGTRFIEVCEDAILNEVKKKAVELFFDEENKNLFREETFKTIFSLANSGGVDVDVKEKLSSYLSRKGLLVSKTYFVLKSETYSDDDDDDNQLPEVLPKRKICNVCHKTMEENDAQCVTCLQNSEYEASLLLDSALFSSIPSMTESEITSVFPSTVESPLSLPEESIAHIGPSANDNDSSPSLETIFTLTEAPTLEDLRDRRCNHFLPTAERATPTTHELPVRRSRVKEDLIEHFKSEEIKLNDELSFHFIDARGSVEPGRGSGVSRDVYAYFWSEAYESLFVGGNERVPFVRHDLFVSEWDAVGKIIYKGYRDCGYFPKLLSKSFLCYVLFDENKDDDLLESFLNYIAADEKVLVKEALSTEDESFMQSDEFFEFLEQFKCRTMVTIANVKPTIIELARQELVQKPHLMGSCWKRYITLLQTFEPFQSPSSINDFYATLQPSSKKILSLLDAHPRGESERECFGYFKRYVRGLDMTMLKKLLRFLTGSDLVTVQKNSIQFVKQSAFERRPIAHTCGPTVELSSTYSNFCELREEFSSILNQNTWEMDII